MGVFSCKSPAKEEGKNTNGNGGKKQGALLSKKKGTNDGNEQHRRCPQTQNPRLHGCIKKRMGYPREGGRKPGRQGERAKRDNHEKERTKTTLWGKGSGQTGKMRKDMEEETKRSPRGEGVD